MAGSEECGYNKCLRGCQQGGQCLSQQPTPEIFAGMSTGRNIYFPIPAKNGKNLGVLEVISQE